MNIRLLVVIAFLLPLNSEWTNAAEGIAAMPEHHRALLENHCQKCHGASKSEAKFRVDDLPFSITNIETAERWQKILNAMNSGEMPPDGEKALPSDAKTNFLDDLANVMVTARRNLNDQRGMITMRRMNRREYRNTLRDLLGATINVSELPADTGTGGFDTVGSNLFMSANQFEQYQSLGREALDEAFERLDANGVAKSLRFECEETTPRIHKVWASELEAHERGKKWVSAVMEAAAKPENQEIVAMIRKTAKDDSIFRRSWEKIAGAPSPESFGFKTVENNADKANRAAGNTYFHPYWKYYQEQPHLDTGAYLTIHGGSDLNDNLTIFVPPKWPVGDYIVRVRTGASKHATPERRFFEFGIHPRHGQVMSTHHVTGTIESPQIVEIPITFTRKHASRDDRTIFIREKGTADHFTQTRAKFGEGRKLNGIGPEFALWIDWMEIERVPNSAEPKPPGLAALQISLDDKMPPKVEEVRDALRRFSMEAFRGASPPDSYLDRLMKVYTMHREAGVSHSNALKDTLSIVLASPMFLYLAEPSTETERRLLTDQEFATRLSYFLWGSPPDATLREIAARGELQKPDVLAAQIQRLLDDRRSEGFVQPFLYQWLGLDRLDFFEINRTLYPRFDDSTKLASRNEVYETFAYLLRSNGSLRDLLHADYVVINGVLANYYGIDGVNGDEFRKVSLSAESPRGGLLGMAATHVMGGNGERSNPVERGAWVLRKLLNDPPPPAPANVPAIARLAGQVLTTRERLMAHQEEPQCASCHRKIDPIGFGLENFDAAGQWRTEDSYQVTDAMGKPDKSKPKKTWTIDPAGAFYKGPAFQDYFELRNIIASKPERFARGFSQMLVEYALGRTTGFSDEALISDMVDRAAKNNYSIREFILALASSKEFRTK